MIGLFVRAAGLTGIYLLVLTSVAPGDILVGALLGLAVAVALRPRGARPTRGARLARIGAAGSVVLGTGAEMVRGSWRVARFCLGLPAAPGFVEIPREDRSDVTVALWGVLTGEAPDEIVVDVDESVLIVHLVDAGDPEAVRARHRGARERQTRVVS